MSDPLRPVTDTEPEIASSPDSLTGEQNYLNPLKSYLNVGNDPKELREVNYIYEQITEGKKLNEGDILMAVREVRLRLGMPRLGETMISKIYNYFRAEATVKNAQKIRDAYLA